MKILKFLALNVLAICPITAVAQQIPQSSYNPSPLGIYNQLKIKDAVTVRSALKVDDLQLGSSDATSGNFNRVVIATQRDGDSNGTVRLSDVHIEDFDVGTPADPRYVTLDLPQATVQTPQVTVRNGGELNADAGYSRILLDGNSATSPVQIALPAGAASLHVPVYADTVFLDDANAFTVNGATRTVGTDAHGNIETINSQIMLDGIQVADLPCINPIGLQRVGNLLLLQCP